MLKTKIEVAAGRPVNTKNGQRYVHQLTVKTDEGYQCFQQWKEQPLQPGVYDAVLVPRAYNNNLGLDVKSMELVK